ncbi:MAG: type II toxin-antitoxin system HicB family antitoxin [Kistimonas sp.]|nr:type II toxin-antitoxin system HicB family antitoxin [Kistimonas sp.]
MNYPVEIEKDGDGFIARFPDVPEALTGGASREETLVEAQGALITAFEFYFEDQRPIPLPSEITGESVAVPVSVWAKVLLLNTMLDAQVTQSELARRMGTRKQELQRVINLAHSTKIDTLARAMKALGKNLTVSVSS